MSNVVLFPGNKNGGKITPPKSLEEVASNIHVQQLSDIENLIEFIHDNILLTLSVNNIKLENDKILYAKDVGLLSEALRSLIRKYYGIDHPYQYLSEKIFRISSDQSTIYCNYEPNSNYIDIVKLLSHNDNI